MRPGCGNFKSLGAGYHLDCLPRAVLYAELASNADIKIDFDELFVLVVIGAGDGENTIDGAELNAYLAAGAAGLIDDGQFARPLLRLGWRRLLDGFVGHALLDSEEQDTEKLAAQLIENEHE